MRVSLTKRFKHILKQEEGESSPTIFHVRQLSGLEVLELSEIQESGTQREMVMYVLEHGLVGWDNLLDEQGRPINFSEDYAENVDLFGIDVLAELTEVIATHSSLDSEAIKN